MGVARVCRVMPRALGFVSRCRCVLRPGLLGDGWVHRQVQRRLLAAVSAARSMEEARAMAKARTARFESADALIDDLEKARQQ